MDKNFSAYRKRRDLKQEEIDVQSLHFQETSFRCAAEICFYAIVGKNYQAGKNDFEVCRVVTGNELVYFPHPLIILTQCACLYFFTRFISFFVNFHLAQSLALLHNFKPPHK